MITKRNAGHAPRVTEVAKELGEIGCCIGCEDCRGLCRALIDAIAVPEAVLHRDTR
ncbi:hypothetical protein [Mameliella sediminis]|uniref:hypothetical protein n=1 Tax=Mameliella sediminis TaxID=2836866 RepID=UPI001C453471|nr:hypothetical protein [Mameliella sediminis]MBY6115991.1 hypothetical protein [Antarctobacter heliothermus]MBY6145231.1 hypothetical protein [Mameliella alba]MBV7394030.1 hypothetical protein [Mameliella sediminis]MBY6162056.1 hypothetical protein [Mameliella alba]MBY6170526.1 hypothetical protein [Mameliella alba]